MLKPWNQWRAIGKLARCISLTIILLRIAIILERSRDWDSSRHVKIKLKEQAIKLKFPEHYLAQHPLTLADLEQEKLEVAKAGYELKLK